MKSARLLLIPLMLVLTSCVVGEAREGSFQRTLSVSGKIRLEIESPAGNITVRTGEGQTVSITGRIRARSSWSGMSGSSKVRELQANPPIEQQGDTIYIGRVSRRELRHNVTISYEITVPPDTELRTMTGAGNQIVRGTKAALELRSGAGNIEVDRVAGDARVHTGAGNIELRSPEGSVVAESGAGSVTADGNPTHDWQVSVGAGSIRLRVPHEASFDLNAQSGFGSVRVNHDLSLQGSVSSSHVNGKVGKGGPSVQLNSGAGSIQVD